MAKEQVDSAEPPPPSVGNDSNKSRGFAENLVCLAFWIERVTASFLVASFYWFPPNVWGSILFIAVGILIHSNSLYLISLFSSLLQMANDRIDANASEVAVIGAPTLGIATGVAIIETLRFDSLAGGTISMIPIAVAILGAALLHVEDKRNNKIDKENTRQQQEAKLNFSSKESKEEVQAKDEMNDKIDEEFTKQQKAKLEVSLKKSKEELRSSCCTREEFQSLEAKYHAKNEILLQKYIDKCHGWKEERSQLMKELGAARASSEIYRELLHGSDDF